jgi:hypothetical protein
VRHGAFARWAWPIGRGEIVAGDTAVILAAAGLLILVPGIEPREWAAEVMFVTAHVVAAEVIVSGHRRE